MRLQLVQDQRSNQSTERENYTVLEPEVVLAG
jgi:hypothetical protein